MNINIIFGGIPIEYLTQQLEKSGSCASYQNIKGRQLGAIKIKSIVSNYIPDDVLKTIDDAIGKPLSLGKSCSSAIANVLNNIIKEFKGIHSNEKLNYELVSILKNDSKFEVKESNDFSECLHPNLRKVEGCSICPDCGYSKCS